MSETEFLMWAAIVGWMFFAASFCASCILYVRYVLMRNQAKIFMTKAEISVDAASLAKHNWEAVARLYWDAVLHFRHALHAARVSTYEGCAIFGKSIRSKGPT